MCLLLTPCAHQANLRFPHGTCNWLQIRTESETIALWPLSFSLPLSKPTGAATSCRLRENAFVVLVVSARPRRENKFEICEDSHWSFFAQTQVSLRFFCLSFFVIFLWISERIENEALDNESLSSVSFFQQLILNSVKAIHCWIKLSSKLSSVCDNLKRGHVRLKQKQQQLHAVFLRLKRLRGFTKLN